MKNITIDFNNVLVTYPYKDDKGEYTINKSLINLVKQWSSYGVDIHILANDELHDKNDIENVIKECDLIIKNVLYIKDKKKIDIIKEIGSDLHISNDITISMEAMVNNIDTMLPPINEDNVYHEDIPDIDFNNRKRPG